MPENRRSQGERSAQTRGLLISAAVDSLVEQGWAATTAVDVCARAGVTRGALMHHFPNLRGLLAAALDAVHDELFASVPGAPRTMVALIDVTWICTSNPRFKAVIEAWLAAANDPGLRTELGPVITRFSKLVSPAESLADLFPDADARAFYFTAREAMLGLALGRAMAPNGVPHEAVVIARLRADAAEIDAR